MRVGKEKTEGKKKSRRNSQDGASACAGGKIITTKKIPSKWKRKKIERNAFFVCVIRKFWTEENFRNRSMDGRGQAARSSQVFWPLLICNWIKIESESQMWVIINAIRSIKLKAQHVSPIQSYADQSIANACPFQPAPPPFRVWFQIFSSKPPPLSTW